MQVASSSQPDSKASPQAYGWESLVIYKMFAFQVGFGAGTGVFSLRNPKAILES